MKTIDSRPQFAIETEKIYQSFELEIQHLRHCPPLKRTDISLREVIISAYVKGYDFIRYICSLSDLKHAFFQLPMLRGICDDLIVLSYIIDQKVEHQNYLLVAKRYEELKKSTKAQVEFFGKYNKGQIVPSIKNEVDLSQILAEYEKAGNVFEQASLPNKVVQMAERTNLKDLYSFIYHATSKVVHFDIFTLLSMGWGELKNEEETLEANYSYQHDYRHYYTFALFYSSYLFIQQTKRFNTFLALSPKIMETLLEIEHAYQQIDWPELVTFQQLNEQPPSFLDRAKFRFEQMEND